MCDVEKVCKIYGDCMKNIKNIKAYLTAFILCFIFSSVGNAGVEILRPNAIGSNTANTTIPAASTNYMMVYEAATDDANYIENAAGAVYRLDTYGLPNHVTPSTYKIIAVRVFMRIRRGTNTSISQEEYLRLGGADYGSAPYSIASANVWEFHTATWTVRPSDSNEWTWTDIDNLEAGIRIYGNSGTKTGQCSQLWVEVEYNQAPSISITNAAIPNVLSSGTIMVSYTLTDPENDDNNLETKLSPNKGFEYSLDNSTWYDGTMGTGGDGNGNPTPLTATSGGTAHQYAWDSKTDLDNTEDTDVYVRMVSSDIAGNLSSTATYGGTNVLRIDNKPPAFSQGTHFTAMPQSGDTSFWLAASFVETNSDKTDFTYMLNGVDGNSCTDDTNRASGATYTCQITAGALEGDDSFTRFSSTHTDLAFNYYNNVVLSTTVYVQPKKPQTPTLGTKTKNSIQVTINKASGENGTGLYYLIRASSTLGGTQYVQDNDSIGGAVNWKTWTEAVAITVTGLESLREYSFSVVAGNPLAAPEPFDEANSTSAFSESAVGTTLPSNYAPSVTITQLSGLTSGQVPISYKMIDDDGDICNLSQTGTAGVEYSLNGSLWNDAFLGSAPGAQGYTGLTGSPAPGDGHLFVWSSTDNINNQEEGTVYIHMKPNDSKEDGASWTQMTGTFSVDNKAATSLSYAVHFAPPFPVSGDTSITLAANFTETNPDKTYFTYKLNSGGSYGLSCTDDNDSTSASCDITSIPALKGDDSFTTLTGTHTDKVNNVYTNEFSTTVFVLPKTPLAPTLDNLQTNSIRVSNNDNSEDGSGVYYVIRGTSAAGGTKYVNQADGSLSLGAEASAWSNAFASQVTVTGLLGNEDYWFSIQAANADDSNPPTAGVNSITGYSPLATAKTANTAPSVTVTNLPAVTSGQVTISYKMIDPDLDTCNITNGVEYSINGSNWFNTSDGAGGDGRSPLTSNADPGTSHTYIWNSAGNLADQEQSTVWVHINPNDGTTDGSWVPTNQFKIDNKAPIVSQNLRFDPWPVSENANFTLKADFTEGNPEKTQFGYKFNGAGSYTWGTDNTDSGNASYLFSQALTGADYFNAIVATHTDKVNFSSTTEIVLTFYVTPKTPSAPTVQNAQQTTIDVIINDNGEAGTGVKYAIKVNSQYVQDSPYTLGAGPVWKIKSAWPATITVTGLEGGTMYTFSVAAGNANAASPTTSDNSATAYGPTNSLSTEGESMEYEMVIKGNNLNFQNIQFR